MRRQGNKLRVASGEARGASLAMRAFPSRNSRLETRRGLTLIELLVTIVIMVTVLAGVIPLMSPNNNSRKIREASRQLTTMLAQAQAQAARDGRPAGVAFREFDSTRPAGPYSGMALEAFFIAEPEAFTGFSAHSRVTWGAPTGLVYGPTVGAIPGNEGTLFSPEHNGRPIFTLTFSIYGASEHLPPQMFKIGDVIELESGNQFLICDDGDPNPAAKPNPTETVNGVEYLLSDLSDTTIPIAGVTVDAIWLNNSGQAMQAPGTLWRYAIRRLPTNSSEAPLQLPRGIGIDLQASGATPLPGTAPLNFPYEFNNVFDSGVPDVVGVMYNANGALEGLYFNGRRVGGVDQVFMLLGIFENGNDDPENNEGSQDPQDYDFTTGSIDRDELAARRGRINWLNPDSRWVVVNRAGRAVASANNVSLDFSQSPYVDDLPTDDVPKAAEQRRRQLNGVYEVSLGSGSIVTGAPPFGANRLEPGVRQFAEQMQTEGGR